MLSFEYQMCSRRRAFRTFTTVAAAAVLFSNLSAWAQWPQWGGANRDFHTPAKGLATKWPEKGPPQLWSCDLTDRGISSPIVHEGIVQAMCRFDDWEEALFGLNTRTGVEEYTLMFRSPVPDSQRNKVSTSPRSTPVIIGDYVYVMSFTGKLVCFNLTSRKYEWMVNLGLDFNATFLEHGYSSSPIGYEGLVIVQLGGKRAGFVAIEAPREKLAWASRPFDNSYASPIIIDLEGEDQLIGMSADKVVAVNPKDGKSRWSYPHENRGTSHLTMPVWGPDGLLFLPASGEGGECRMLRLTREGKKTNVEQVWASTDVHLGPGNVIRVGDYLYGSGGSDGAWHITAVKAATGEVAWREPGFSWAALTYAGDKLIIRDADGMVAIATPTPNGLMVHSKVKLLEKSPPSVPALADTTLFVRDDSTVKAFDLKKKPKTIK